MNSTTCDVLEHVPILKRSRDPLFLNISIDEEHMRTTYQFVSAKKQSIFPNTTLSHQPNYRNCNQQSVSTQRRCARHYTAAHQPALRTLSYPYASFFCQRMSRTNKCVRGGEPEVMLVGCEYATTTPNITK